MPTVTESPTQQYALIMLSASTREEIRAGGKGWVKAPTHLWSALEELVRQGFAERDGKGLWRVTTAGMDEIRAHVIPR